MWWAKGVLSSYGARKVVLLLSLVPLSWKLDRKCEIGHNSFAFFGKCPNGYTYPAASLFLSQPDL